MSMSPPPSNQRQRRSRSRGGARSLSTDYESDAGPSRRGQRRRGGRGSGLPGISEDQQQVGQYSPQQIQQQRQQQLQQQQAQQPPAQEEEGGGDEALKLKLELNLDVWVELKAKVHGDVTLSMLG
ncbi:hypothetical protein EV122DRAFT_253108 [Schizophyllum commune]